MTRQQLANRLRIPASEVTAEGLYEHEFPGVIGCVPENLRGFVIERIGGELLRAGLEDEPGETWRYDAALQNARSMAAGEEMRGASRCHGATSGVGQGGGHSGAIILGSAAALAAAALAIRSGVGGDTFEPVRRFLRGA